MIGLFNTDVTERDMDFLFAEELECNPEFRQSFLKLAGVADTSSNEIVELRRSVNTTHGETDLLLVLALTDGTKHALMIENKVAAEFTPLQPERYRRRGEEGLTNGLWDSYLTVLLAPKRRLTGVADAAFDRIVAYEELEQSLAGNDCRVNFKRRIIRAACGKAKVPWVQKVDPSLTAWFVEARSYGIAQFPDLPLPIEGRGRAPTSKWFLFYLPAFPSSRVAIEIKPHTGFVDLRLFGVRIGDLRRELGPALPSGAETDEAKTMKSVAIRIKHAIADTDRPFSEQQALMLPMFESADRLMRFAEAHRAEVMHLLGYAHN